jgi:hypothetical protein
MFCFFLISNLLISIIFIDFNVKNAWSEGQYSQTWVNDHLWIMATCSQWPVWYKNG